MVDPLSAGTVVAKVTKTLDGPPAPDGPAEVVAALADLDLETAAFLTKASGGELRSLVTPDLRYFRLKHALRVARKAAKLLKSAGREATRGDMNVVIPVLEAASLQEDEELVDRWAALLANATDPEGASVEPGFSDVLRQLSAADARLFDHIVSTAIKVVGDRWVTLQAHRIGLSRQGPIDDQEEFAVALENLLRLRLIVELPSVQERRRPSRQAELVLVEDGIKVSAYGVKFARAVSRDCPQSAT
jgi:Abortive infection alpha